MQHQSESYRTLRAAYFDLGDVATTDTCAKLCEGRKWFAMSGGSECYCGDYTSVC